MQAKENKQKKQPITTREQRSISTTIKHEEWKRQKGLKN